MKTAALVIVVAVALVASAGLLLNMLLLPPVTP